VWIKAPVQRGERLNDWLYGRAFHLAKIGAKADSTAKLLADLVGSKARPGEIQRQVSRGYAAARGKATTVGAVPGGTSSAAGQWPDLDHDAVVDFVGRHRATVADLASMSPHPAPEHPLDVLRTLHGDDGLLCMAPSPLGGFETRTIGEWEDRRNQLPRWQMVVPNLMRARTGRTITDGTLSGRTRDNSCGLGNQRFLVVEFDIRHDAEAAVDLGMAPPDICASLILGKMNLQQIRMVVHSGGKSLHAWVAVKDLTQERIDRFYRAFCRFGADKAGRLPEQQFRLPQGYRADKAAVQRVIYWNPED